MMNNPVTTNDKSEINQKTISTLNDLIETCRDGQKGFEEAATGLQDPAVKTLFQSFSHQRQLQCTELQSLVRRQGGDPEQTGSVSGALHRGWMNLKTALTGKNDKALIDEAERGEDVAMASYQSALKQDLPLEVRTVIEQQFTAVKAAHDRVRALKHAGDQKQNLRS